MQLKDFQNSRSPQSKSKGKEPLSLCPVRNFNFLTSEEELALWSESAHLLDKAKKRTFAFAVWL